MNVGKTLENLLSGEILFFCWILAFLNKGITANEIKDRFGQEGLKSLKILEKQTVIAKDGDDYKSIEASFLSQNLSCCSGMFYNACSRFHSFF